MVAQKLKTYEYEQNWTGCFISKIHPYKISLQDKNLPACKTQFALLFLRDMIVRKLL